MRMILAVCMLLGLTACHGGAHGHGHGHHHRHGHHGGGGAVHVDGVGGVHWGGSGHARHHHGGKGCPPGLAKQGRCW